MQHLRERPRSVDSKRLTEGPKPFSCNTYKKNAGERDVMVNWHWTRKAITPLQAAISGMLQSADQVTQLHGLPEATNASLHPNPARPRPGVMYACFLPGAS